MKNICRTSKCERLNNCPYNNDNRIYCPGYKREYIDNDDIQTTEEEVRHIRGAIRMFMPVKIDKKSGRLKQGRKYKNLENAVKKELKLEKKGYQVVMMYSENGNKWSSLKKEKE